VAATATLVPAAMFTSKMRAMLAISAAQRGRLDEALCNLRHIPTPSERHRRPILEPTATAQILALAAREKRIVAATEELQRLQAKLETKLCSIFLLLRVEHVVLWFAGNSLPQQSH